MSTAKVENVKGAFNQFITGIFNFFSGILNWIKNNFEFAITILVFILIALFLLWLSWLLNKYALSNFGWVMFIIFCVSLLWFLIYFVYGQHSLITWCANAVCPILIFIFYLSLTNAVNVKTNEQLYS